MCRSRALPLALLCSLIFAVVAAAQAPPASQPSSETQQSEPIRVSVNRVNVGVFVIDSSGKFVEGLPRESFHIFDNGVEQPITDFLAVQEPAQVLMFIEAGPAVYLLEGGHLLAARAFLNGLSADDRVAVVKYADKPQGIVDFTTDKPSVAGAFDDLGFNIGFGSLNLSSSLSKALDWLGAVQGKKTIVLLSTGVDTSSEADIDNLLQRLKTSDVRILAVSLTGNLRNPPAAVKRKSPPPKATLTAEQFEQADRLLRQIAQSSGGQAYFPMTANELSADFAQIALIVRHEFSLAFAPPVQDGAVHSVEVRIRDDAGSGHNFSEYRVEYRRAYLAPSAVIP